MTHGPEKCEGEHCCIHNPSDHHMREWPMAWRQDAGKMERICPHGVGHPDPDDAAYQRKLGMSHKNVHGCDGCCRKKKPADISEMLRDAAKLLNEGADEIERLRLTDAEREAIDDAAEDAEIEADHRRREGEKVWASHYDDKARSLRSILERLK